LYARGGAERKVKGQGKGGWDKMKFLKFTKLSLKHLRDCKGKIKGFLG